MSNNEKSSVVLTDTEIKKALECCISAENCCECVYTKMCDGTTIHQFALDLINRQQAEIESITEKFNCQQTVYADLSKIIKDKNAEIERLKNECFCIANERDAIADCLNTAAAEAIKEFAERLKKQSFTALYHKMVLSNDIDNLVKEMVGDAE